MDALLPNTGSLAFGWRDVLDILLMTVLIYQLGMLLRGTRALQTLIGVLLVMIAYALTGPDRLLDLRTFHRVLGAVLFYAPFALIVLFQTTIRRALSRLGRTSLLRLGYQEITEKMLDDIVQAATTLATRPTGALIVIEGDQALRDQVASGIQLDAAVSYDLLMNIFTPGSPMHDGAAIIGEGRVKAASCFLQVTPDPQLSREYGSRHRAAIGLTEEYDSVVVVISEERGEIRGAVEGRLTPPLDAAGLKAFLRAHLGGRRNLKENGAAQRTHAA
jgi:diadenylate cyclase